MSSRKLYIIELDQYVKQSDLDFIQSLPFDIAYQEYAFGVWETLSIWNKEDTDGDAILWDRVYCS
ncbi:hypothetical protein [Vibrio metschnikovii]|uniref:hypothetical protein n=1 Tax=Vibrio metschnikovii TaxID=28172 RepID=UPI002FCA7AFF